VGFAAVNAGDLVEVLWASLLAGVGVTLTFSLIVFGSVRGATARRAGQEVQALAYGALTVLALAVFVAGVVFGLNIMLSKD
jgi:uncharacterized membrane protein